MELDLYTVRLTDGQTFWMLANLAEASAPIRANFHDPDDDGAWQNTPYQTADASHRATEAAHLVATYFSTGPDDEADVESVE
jgi:hypothetical protein